MILDIMSSSIAVAGQSDFTATAPGALYLPVTAPGVNGLPFADANGNQWFTPGDNILLQKAVPEMPYSFGQGPGLHVIGISWQNVSNGFYIIRELAGNGVLSIPDLDGVDFEGQAGANGLMITCPNGSGEKKRLVLTTISLNVSQLNLPADLAGVLIKVQYCLQVVHGIKLEATP